MRRETYRPKADGRPPIPPGGIGGSAIHPRNSYTLPSVLPTDEELAKVHRFLVGVANFFDTLDPDEHDNLAEASEQAYKLAAMVDPRRHGRR